jgi:serine acetyltransferase
VYLAAGATVLGNIRVGEGSVVNAGSVVTKPVEPYTRVGGVPAKLVSRFDADDSETYVDMSQANYNEDGLDGDEIPIFPSVFNIYPGEYGMET